MERIFDARRSLVVVARTEGYSWMAGRNFSCRSQILGKCQDGGLGRLCLSLTRVQGVLTGEVVSSREGYAGQVHTLILLLEDAMLRIWDLTERREETGKRCRRGSMEHVEEGGGQSQWYFGRKPGKAGEKTHLSQIGFRW
jgi:hypothetical protein